ncbi:hypothetical protein GOODEAATRI_003813 [Goodea atripinnis]|uniref:Uncharacterized protein n=1 Tax=Goodea atripinnis TaxID=208336 RepID=A0ABV0MFZ5_9TELE
MNTLASRLLNQLSRWEEGKSNLMAATRRGDCFSSQSQESKSSTSSGSDGGREEKWKATGLHQLSSWAGCTHFPPSYLFPLLPPTRPDTTYQSLFDTGDYIPASNCLDETEQ